MKIFFVVVLAVSNLVCVELCCPAETSRQIAMSDKRQLKCARESVLPNAEFLSMRFEEDGKPWDCVEISQTDPDFDKTVKYPSTPEVAKNQKTFSYSAIGEDDQAINCFQAERTVNDEQFPAVKGFFPVEDLKDGTKYMCVRAMNSK